MVSFDSNCTKALVLQCCSSALRSSGVHTTSSTQLVDQKSKLLRICACIRLLLNSVCIFPKFSEVSSLDMCHMKAQLDTVWAS